MSAVALGRDGIVAGGSASGKSWLWNSATAEQTPVRSRLHEVFVGSTAERVLDRIGGDVLVVKPADFTEKLPF